MARCIFPVLTLMAALAVLTSCKATQGTIHNETGVDVEIRIEGIGGRLLGYGGMPKRTSLLLDYRVHELSKITFSRKGLFVCEYTGDQIPKKIELEDDFWAVRLKRCGD